MPYNTKALLVDINGRFIPQQFNEVIDDYVPYLDAVTYGKSTDVKPINDQISKGHYFVEIDTKKIYINDGENWELWFEGDE